MDMTLCSVLQIMSLSFDSTVSSISSCLGIGMLLLNIVTPFMILSKLRVSQGRTSESSKKYAYLTEDFKNKPKICHFFNMILLIRRFLLPILLVLTYYVSSLQIISVLAIHSIPGIVVLLYAPYKDVLSSFSNAIDEVLTFTIYFITGLIHYANQNKLIAQKTKEMIGWGLIGCISISCMINTALIMFTGIKAVIDFVRNLRKIPSSEMIKVMPIKGGKSVHLETKKEKYASHYMTVEKKLVRLKKVRTQFL